MRRPQSCYSRWLGRSRWLNEGCLLWPMSSSAYGCAALPVVVQSPGRSRLQLPLGRFGYMSREVQHLFCSVTSWYFVSFTECLKPGPLVCSGILIDRLWRTPGRYLSVDMVCKLLQGRLADLGRC